MLLSWAVIQMTASNRTCKKPYGNGTWATQSPWHVTRTNLTEQRSKASLNDLFTQSCSVQTWENMTSFKLPPLSYAASMVHEKILKQAECFTKRRSQCNHTNASTKFSKLPWCLTVIRVKEWWQHLQSKTLPFILFCLLASQMCSKG